MIWFLEKFGVAMLMHRLAAILMVKETGNTIRLLQPTLVLTLPASSIASMGETRKWVSAFIQSSSD